MTDEFDGWLYALSYARPGAERVTTEPVGSRRIAADGATHAFREPGVASTTQAYRRGFIARLAAAPTGTDVRDPVTRCTFRIDVVGRLPIVEEIRPPIVEDDRRRLMKDNEPVLYAWMRDGLLVAGTLADYAKMWEGDQYAGEHDLTRALLTWQGEGSAPVIHEVTVERGFTSDGWVEFLLRVPTASDVERVKLPADKA